jgi:hypothetical protein
VSRVKGKTDMNLRRLLGPNPSTRQTPRRGRLGVVRIPLPQRETRRRGAHHRLNLRPTPRNPEISETERHDSRKAAHPYSPDKARSRST